jgi:hypothetical protein
MEIERDKRSEREKEMEGKEANNGKLSRLGSTVRSL